jgi:hypothetical protein
MKHIHHIIPRHAGGTDEPENLIELTVEEHARAHYLLWNRHGRWQDKLAWKSLTGMIGQEEIMLTVQTEAALEAWTVPAYRENLSLTRKERWMDPVVRERYCQGRRRQWTDPSYRDKTIPKLKEFQLLAIDAALSPESRQKRIDSFKRIEHNKGSKNPMFGKMWITNGIESYRIDKNDPIPAGYRKGRVCSR